MAFAQQDSKSDTAQNGTINRNSTANQYQGIIETGYSWGLGEWGQSVFRLNVINSIRLPHYSIGIGTGFSILNRQQNQLNGIRFDYQVPIFLDNRIYFSNKSVRPFLAFGIGLSIVAHDMLADLSLFLNSSTGIFWNISDSVSLIIGISFESYTIKYDDGPDGATKINRQSISLGPSIGISF